MFQANAAKNNGERKRRGSATGGVVSRFLTFRALRGLANVPIKGNRTGRNGGKFGKFGIFVNLPDASTENNEKRKTSALTVGGGDSVAASEEKTTFFFKNDKIVAEADEETPINFPEDIPEARTSRSGSRR